MHLQEVLFLDKLKTDERLQGIMLCFKQFGAQLDKVTFDKIYFTLSENSELMDNEKAKRAARPLQEWYMLTVMFKK